MSQSSVERAADERTSRLIEDLLTDTGLVDADATTKRSNRRGDLTRDKLVRAATECFSEYGYARTRISDITHRAGTAQGNFYRHFASLDDIFLAVLRPALIDLADNSAGGGRVLSLDSLVDKNTTYLQTYARHRHTLRLLREAAASSTNEGFLRLWLQVRGDFVARTRRWLQRLRDEGAIGETNLDLLAESLGCLTEQMAYVHVGLASSTPRREELEDLGRALGEVWFRSLPPVDA